MFPLTMNKYQEKAHKFANYKDNDYPYYGIVEELGELFGKLARVRRGDKTIISSNDLELELGDVLWNLSEIAWKHNIKLNHLATMNIRKLKRRKRKGIIMGNGDNR